MAEDKKTGAVPGESEEWSAVQLAEGIFRVIPETRASASAPGERCGVCPACGRSIPAGDGVCPFCGGQRYGQAAPAPALPADTMPLAVPSPRVPRRKGAVIAIMAAGVLLAGAVMTAILLLSQRSGGGSGEDPEFPAEPQATETQEPVPEPAREPQPVPTPTESLNPILQPSPPEPPEETRPSEPAPETPLSEEPVPGERPGTPGGERLTVTAYAGDLSDLTPASFCGAQASSELRMEDGFVFSATNVLGDAPSIPWGAAFVRDGDAPYLLLTCDGEQTISVLWLRLGYAGAYRDHGRPRRVEFEFSDGRTAEYEFEDADGDILIQFSAPAHTERVKLTIRSIYPGEAGSDDVCITRVSAYRRETEDDGLLGDIEQINQIMNDFFS